MAQSSNPLRNIVKQSKGGPSTSMSSNGLVINGIYHVDSVVRPAISTKDQIAPPPGFSSITTQDSLRLPGARTPDRNGWVSPEAFGGIDE